MYMYVAGTPRIFGIRPLNSCFNKTHTNRGYSIALYIHISIHSMIHAIQEVVLPIMKMAFHQSRVSSSEVPVYQNLECQPGTFPVFP